MRQFFKAAILGLLPFLAFAQISTSPGGVSYQTGVGSLSQLPSIPNNTVLGNVSGAPGAPSALAKDSINLKDYIGTSYVPARLSGVFSGYTANITTNGTTTVTCSSGCNWSAGDIGDAFVAFVEGTTNTCQSTIAAVASATSITLAGACGFTSAGGAKAYYGTDLTTQINAAMSAAIAAGRCLYIPGQGQASGGYFYNGAGANSWRAPCIVGDGDQISLIYLGTTSFMIDDNFYWNACTLSKVGYIGGYGAFRNRYTPINVSSGPCEISSNYFYEFSAAAISSESADWTYYQISKNTCSGLNTINTMCVAILGADSGSIDHNSFINYRFAVKIGAASVNSRQDSNDYLEFTPDNTDMRAGVWLVPGSGYGFLIAHSKFGNENIGTNDTRVLIADSVASSGGNYFGNTLPTGTASVGVVNGLMFLDNVVVGGGSGQNPIFYSYTPTLRQFKVTGNLQGNYPSYVFQFDGTVTAVNDYTTLSSIIGPFQWQGYGFSNVFISSIPGYGMAVDSSGDEEYYDALSITPWTTGAGFSAHTNYLTTLINSFTIIGGGSKSAIADGNTTDAARFTMGANGSGNEFYALTTGTPLNVQGWFEFDARQGASGTPITSMIAAVADNFSFPLLCQRTITLAATWHHYKMPCVLRSTPTHAPPNVEFISGSSSAIGQTVDIGQVRYYTNTEPVGSGLFLTPVEHRGLIDTGPTFTASGCSNGTLLGGSAAGSYHSGTTGTCTVTVTFGGGLTAPNAADCSVHDVTTPADTQTMTTSTATTATFSGTTVSGDVIKFGCQLF
jgi:hypothetical protein